MDSSTDKRDDFPLRQRAAETPRTSYDQQELDDWREALNHPAIAATLRIVRLVLRGLVIFVFSFIEIVAELLAPIVLILGIGWSLLPGILSLAGPEGQAHDMVATVVQAIPRDIHVGRMVLTPSSLIMDGLLLIAVVALCRTIETIIASDA